MILLWPLLCSALAFVLHLIHARFNIKQKYALLLNPIGICIFAYMSIINLLQYGDIQYSLFKWVSFSFLEADIAVFLDRISKPMLSVVATISALVHIFAIGYMPASPRIYLFLSYISIFTFFMTILVVAGNFVQLFIGWEGVGFASFLLIGFYNSKDQAGHCAVKAFMVNRVADVFFIIGIALVFMHFNTMYFDSIQKIVTLESDHGIMLIAICSCLVIGAFGKSAQFGLHTWLPDAMIAPTPTSILLHAATMVTAGVFMLVRVSYMLDVVPILLNAIAYIGLMTAFFAGTVAICQNDIKKIVAYSTCSQLGYMVLAIGAGAYSAAMFHLTTHAFFKALLFSASGLIICYMDHKQDIRVMGRIGKIDPLLCICMWIGTLALAGIPPFAGAISKDIILTSIIDSNHLLFPKLLFYGGVFCAFLTALYSTRLMFYVFHSESSYPTVILPKWDRNCMLIPIIITTVFAVISGVLFKDYFIHGSHGHHVDLFYEIITPIAAVCGIILSLFVFVIFKREWGNLPLARFFEERWYIDRLYTALFVNNFFRIANISYKIIDKSIIDAKLVVIWRAIFQFMFFRLDYVSSGSIRAYVAIAVVSISGLFLYFIYV